MSSKTLPSAKLSQSLGVSVSGLALAHTTRNSLCWWFDLFLGYHSFQRSKKRIIFYTQHLQQLVAAVLSAMEHCVAEGFCSHLTQCIHSKVVMGGNNVVGVKMGKSCNFRKIKERQWGELMKKNCTKEESQNVKLITSPSCPDFAKITLPTVLECL